MDDEMKNNESMEQGGNHQSPGIDSNERNESYVSAGERRNEMTQGNKGCQCQNGESGLPGQSQSLKDDDTNTEDIVGASHYERAEKDMSEGINGEEDGDAPYRKAMDEENRIEETQARDSNDSIYMDELKEESESIGKSYGQDGEEGYGQMNPGQFNQGRAASQSRH